MKTEKTSASTAAHYLHQAESIVLVLIAIVLIVLSIFLLGSSVLGMFDAVMKGTVRDSAIDILDSVLLVLMTMEIVYTVAVSLESHTLVAEPFLIIGAIAAIRRMLIITATSTRLETSNVEAFRSTLIELGLLALIIIAIALSIYFLRRAHSMSVARGEQEAHE